MRHRDIGLVVAGGVFVLDQGMKLLLLYTFGLIEFTHGEAIQVLPFFNLTMVWNCGISLGLFSDCGPERTVVLATFQMIAAGVLGWWLWSVRRRALAVELGLVIGGALGNLIDRLVYGRVADFFHLYAFGYSFYVFNVADAAITFGVVGLLYDALLKPEEPQGQGEAGKE